MLSFTSTELNMLLAAYAWPLARILAFISAAPILGNPTLPMRVKIALAMLLTVLVVPMLPPPPAGDPASAHGLLVLAQQLMIGLAMGLTLNVIFHAVEMAGELIGLQMGLGFATLYDARLPGLIPVIGQYMGVIFSLAFLSVNGHLVMISTLVESFRLLPIAALSAPSGLLSLVTWAGHIFALALGLSLPLLAALLLTNLALAVLTRAAPQLNIFAIGFPLTILVGFVALALTLPYFAPVFERNVMEGFEMMLKLARELRVGG